MVQHLALVRFLNVFPPGDFEASAKIESPGRVTYTILLQIRIKTIKTDIRGVTSYLFIQQMLFVPGC